MFVSRRMLRRADAEEDLYAGFDEEAHPAFDTQTLAVDEAFQQAVQSSHGRGPPTSSGSTTAFRLATARSSAAMRRGVGTANGRPVTGGEIARPVTAVRGAGFQSGASGIRGTNVGVFDPLNQAKSSPIVTLQLKDENDPKERIKDMEACINSLVEESVRDASKRNFKLALEKAKEAASRDRQLAKQREQILAGSPANMELSFCVSLNLALRYTDADMLSEALEIYQGIVQNRAFSNIGRLKLNMGNICFMQENFPKAVKFYRMALDQVPNMQKDLRIKILKNIGTAFVKMGQFADAITSFEYIMAEKCDIQAALHLILCHYMLGDVDKMKRAFIKLLDVDNASLEPTELAGGPPRNDLLHKMEQKRKRDTEFTIMTAANLITPVIFPTAAEGYDWCIEQMKASTNFSYLASDLELNKATAFLRKREFGKAIETLKSFEKRDNRNVSAANNLSYLYFMLDKRQAEKYADAAIAIDKYNAAALVNKGIIRHRLFSSVIQISSTNLALCASLRWMISSKRPTIMEKLCATILHRCQLLNGWEAIMQKCTPSMRLSAALKKLSLCNLLNLNGHYTLDPAICGRDNLMTLFVAMKMSIENFLRTLTV
ncbi:intraflagellar transport protein 88 homolog isoform X4 [Varroa destructor]|uniref:Intraflagellar transport protein 88 n=1 Tax=Varroa destructor TaxID=109461 RepID=A0A7M7MEZ7_VARDE|nr:intraflagellar transport protein 88 homolog isoform X4 [Varroa destructor]